MRCINWLKLKLRTQDIPYFAEKVIMDYTLLKKQIEDVNKVFYDKVFKDEWLSQIFHGVDQKLIETQQTDFMLGAFGGPKNYSGRNPKDAHTHINVTEEMWQLREKYLKQAFAETNFPEEFATKWIRIDEAFKAVILKKDVSECKGRYATEPIIDIPNPNRFKKAG